MEWWLLYAIVGVAAGFLAGLLGVGGGVVIVPALVFAFAAQDVPAPHVMPLALGTSLATIVCTAAASLRAHHTYGAVRWDLVGRLSAGVVVGAFAGASVATRVSSEALTIMFVLFIWMVATHLWWDTRSAPGSPVPGSGGLLVMGGVIGFVSGVVGIGGGSMTVPVLTWRRVSIEQAIGTSAAVGLPLAAAGAAGYVVNGIGQAGLPPLSIGYVHLAALAGIAIPSIITAPFGAKSAHRWATRGLKRAFAAFLYVVGVLLLIPVLMRS